MPRPKRDLDYEPAYAPRHPLSKHRVTAKVDGVTRLVIVLQDKWLAQQCQWEAQRIHTEDELNALRFAYSELAFHSDQARIEERFKWVSKD